MAILFDAPFQGQSQATSVFHSHVYRLLADTDIAQLNAQQQELKRHPLITYCAAVRDFRKFCRLLLFLIIYHISLRS